MSEFVLKRKTGLNLEECIAETWHGFAFEEIRGESIYWVSASANSYETLTKTARKAFSLELPGAGRFADGVSGSAKCRFASFGPGQWLAIGIDGDGAAQLDRATAVTEISDSLVGFRLVGRRLHDVLEKLVSIDIHPSVFPTGTTARFPTEGMLTMLLCEEAKSPTFVVYFERSSARDFVARMRKVAYGVCGARIPDSQATEEERPAGQG